MNKKINPNTIVGHVDNLGYLHCLECDPDNHSADRAVYVNSEPHAFEPCDCCGVILNHRVKSPEENKS